MKQDVLKETVREFGSIADLPKTDQNAAQPMTQATDTSFTENGNLANLSKTDQNAAKERGEEPQVWDDYLEDKKKTLVSFPGRTICKKYMLVSIYPKERQRHGTRQCDR